ncbi:hypothetical protein B0H14DRAFT_3886337, partial [Mycena olivaceomarginata]
MAALSASNVPSSTSPVWSMTLPSFNSPIRTSTTSTLGLPTYGPSHTSGISTLALLTFNDPSDTSALARPTNDPSDTSALARPTNDPSPTGALTLPTSDPSPTSGLPTLALPTFDAPTHTSGISTFALPTLNNNPSQSGFSSSHTMWSSTPVSSTSMAYDPISTVAFSRLQTSFTAIEVSSDILAAEVFLYGVYLVMFGFYLNVLRSRGVAKNRGLTFATILLFIFCTAHCALQITTSTLYNRLESTSLGDSESVFNQTFKDYTAVAMATDAVYVTSTVIADSIFILRCYAIWDFHRKVIVFPILLTLAVAGVGYTNAFWTLHTPNSLRSTNLFAAEFSFKLLKISVLLSISTTVILMVLSAGRIWWIGRAARILSGQSIINRYNTVCAMILESGAVYCASAIVFATIGFTLDPIYSTTGAVLGQLVGIAPIIIAVRVGLGHSVGSVENVGAQDASSVSTLQLKAAHSRDEAAVEDVHGGLGNCTTRHYVPPSAR